MSNTKTVHSSERKTDSDEHDEEQKKCSDHLKTIQKEIYRIAEECASLELTKQDISDETRAQVESLQTELSRRMVCRTYISCHHIILIHFKKAQWHRESTQWPQQIRSLFEKEYHALKQQEQSLNSRADCDFKTISENMVRLHGDLQNLSEQYDQKLEEFLSPIKAITLLLQNNTGFGAKYIARMLTSLPRSFYELFQRVESLCEGDLRIELYFDHEDISYHIGTTEELMSVYEIAVSSNIDKIKLRVEHSLKQ